MPDRLYVWQAGRYGAVEYGDLYAETGETQFIESDGVPPDAHVVGRTWRFVNKNGGPDRRFNNNCEIPIASYGVVSLTSRTGLNVLLHISRKAAVQGIGMQFGRGAGPHHRKNERPAHEQTQQAPPKEKPSAASLSIPNCYIVLNLTPDCSAEQAANAYRQLAKSYHPDVVAHLATEFRAVAEERMKEINIAYTEVKRLRSW